MFQECGPKRYHRSAIRFQDLSRSDMEDILRAMEPSINIAQIAQSKACDKKVHQKLFQLAT
eukprot:4456338-Prorocentrum_lima.AAC.1